MERADDPSVKAKHENENPLPRVRRKQYHNDEKPVTRPKTQKAFRQQKKRERNERFHKFLVEEKKIQGYSVEELGHIFSTGLSKHPSLCDLYTQFKQQNTWPVHAESSTLNTSYRVTEMDRQMRDSMQQHPRSARQQWEHHGPSGLSWRNKTVVHERHRFDCNNSSTDYHCRYEQPRGRNEIRLSNPKEKNTGHFYSSKQSDTHILHEVWQEGFGDEVINGEYPKQLDDSSGGKQQISPEQAEMTEFGIRNVDEMEAYLDKFYGERIPVVQKWTMKVPPVSSDEDLDVQYPWEPKPFSSSLSWLQKHVTETCGGVEPKTIGPYNVHHLQKVQAGWTKHYIKGLDRELKPVDIVS